MPKTPETWRERVTVEAKELKDKLDALTAFKDSAKWDELPDAQRTLLTSQHTFMTLYLGVLNDRLALPEPAAAEEPAA